MTGCSFWCRDLKRQAIRFYNASGSEAANLRSLKLQVRRHGGKDRPFVVYRGSRSDLDETFATDFMLTYHVDIDFGADKTEIFRNRALPRNVVC